METLRANTRFGTVDYSVDDVITFDEGVIGFPDLTEYLVLAHKEGSPFRWLQSIQEPTLAFLIVDPSIFLAEYAPEMDPHHAIELQLDEATPRLVYTIVTIPKGKPEEMSLNLAGPIVVNGSTRRAKQIVLEDSAYAVKFMPKNQAGHPEETAAA